MTDHELQKSGFEIAELLIHNRFQEVADKYSYALSFDLPPVLAIEKDFKAAVNECHGLINNNEISVSVTHFSENPDGLKTLIECDIPFELSTGIWVELILNHKGVIYLEQISSYRGIRENQTSNGQGRN